MMNIKEIKGIKLAPFTRMTASIYAVLGFVAAVVMLIGLTIVQVAGVIPELGHFNLVTGVGIPLIVLLPIGAFFSTIVMSFFSVMLYNVLVPRLGGVKLELVGNEVENIPVVPFSLILSAIGAVWAFILGLVLAAVISPLFSLIGAMGTMPEAASITANLTASGVAIPTGPGIGVAEAIVSLVLIIGLPIMAFVFGFIWNALFALFYNYLVSRVAKIQLEFGQITGSLHELKHIPVLPTALSVALVFTLLGLISGILSKNYGEFISNFVVYFIETALIALLYNYLAPRIGSIKLNLE
ncbi:MAG TPA: hypothetical protein PKK85_01180 [Methanobacteriaceae archaeon]|jgi:hypothetical protein|nr:hypothetical protein [Methanobacteriaceae archaeon]